MIKIEGARIKPSATIAKKDFFMVIIYIILITKCYSFVRKSQEYHVAKYTTMVRII